MIRLFDKDETNFDSNGLGVLDPAIKENVVEEKMNGIYNFDFAYLSKGKHASQLEGDMIIKAPTPDGDQLFRVYKVTKNIGFLEVNCYHIFYDLAGNFIEDTNIVSQSGQAAITHFGTGLQYATRFKFVSNIVGTNSARMVRLNAVQALLDSSQDNSFLSRWGGEIKRDNFTVYMNDVRGNDKGFEIRHGKNLTGYEANIDYSTVVTRIMPYGYNGLMLPEKYVDSPLRDKYAFTRIKKIEYTNIKAIDPDATSNDESAVPLEEAYKLLRQAAELEYSVNKVDIPTSNFKVTFKNLSDTKEYADFKALEKVDPWDYVTVIADNLDIKSRMISYKYDAITKAYKEVELGNYVPSFTDISSKVDHANDVANQANDTANTAAESANGKNSNYYGPSEPSRPVDGDLWYKKNGDKTELWQYDGKSVPPSWELIVDDATGEEVRQNVDVAQKEAEEAKNQANKAVDGANDAVAKAGFANDTADQAKNDAADALTNAKKALTDSGSAMADSAQAIKDSATAKIQAANAATQANQAVTDASTAKADAAAAKGQATNALGQANTAIGNALTALNKVNDMSVGGTNLLLDTETETGAMWFTPGNNLSAEKLNGCNVETQTGDWTSARYSFDDLKKRNVINTTDDFVFSAMIRVDSTLKDNPARIVFLSTATDKDFTTIGHIKDYADGYWHQISMVFKFLTNPTPTDAKAYNQSLRFELADSNGATVYWAQRQLEKGNKATAWSPAPEDVQIQIDNVNGELSQKVSQTTYNNLAGTVDTVSTLAKQNQSTISTLATKTSVDTVNKTATTAQTLAQQNANELLNKASTNTVDTLTQRVTTAESTLSQTATKAELALTKTDVDKLNDTVKSQGVTLDATATKAELQVAQTNVDDLKKTVTSNTAGITANANVLKLKADSSTVSDIYGRVTSLSGQLDVQSDLISAKVTASDVTGMLGNYATQTWTQSQIKVTADGINSTLSSVQTQVQNSAVGTNLYTDTQNFDNLESWYTAGPSGFWTKTTDTYKGLAVVQTTVDWNGLSQYIQVKKGDILTYSIYAKYTSGTGTSSIYWYLNNSSEGNYSGATANPSYNSVNITDSWQRVSGTAVATSDGYLRPRIERTDGNTNTLQIAGIKVEKGGVATDWRPNPADNATVTAFSKLSQTVNGIQTTVSGKADQSQITQLSGQITSVVGDVSANSSQITQMKADINLRVQKGDVVNQINISPEGILIDGKKVHITGQTTIDNAVIKDAMIADIKADKITAGTLNAANVNVINLNANNITTGTIKGANLSMNLNTGEVVFQHGRIHSASNNVDVNIDQGYLSTASSDTRVMLKEGQLQLVQPTIFDNSKDPYLEISNSVGGASFNGANIIARDYLVLANRANAGEYFDEPIGQSTFAGLAVGRSDYGGWQETRLGGADRGVKITGGKTFTLWSVLDKNPTIRVGSLDPNRSDRISIEGSYVHIPSVYWRTASGGPNVIVAEDGALVRSTSASKYKTDIIRTNIPDYGEKLLELPTATWTDIAETKRYQENPTTQPKPTRNFGMIAEDLAEAGLEMLVVRGTDGELEGINYDRIGPALIPVIAKLKNEVETLKQQLEAETA